MRFNSFAQSMLIGTAAAVVVLAAPDTASACGGFFCSSPNLPINQAAEKIIFSANADGTVTAVIQILYQGPAPKFSWLLPISSVPQPGQLGVASNLAFQRLQTATNPQYSLTVRVEGTCDPLSVRGGGGVSVSTAPDAGAGPSPSPPASDGVTVESSGMVGAFDFAVISVDQTVADPADLAINWLTTNGYSVSPGAPGLIRPYLVDGLHLLALKLTKGSDTGSIRPIVLTYDGKSPMIPIKLTAVAANNDMGVMAWLLSDKRGVPQNYLSLELNEAKINWFNANSNYNAVVTAAADEANGQGFVTEYARPSSALANVVWSAADESRWQTARTTVYQGFQQIFNNVNSQWGRWDGFWDAVRATVTLPTGVAFADFQLCPDCYAARVQFTPSALFDALQKDVIQPVKDTQALLDKNGYVTRLYTTMSPADMTVDPLFTFNGSLGDVNNVHTAVRVIECSPGVTQFEAPWRIELPQGGIVRGAGTQVGTWPAALGKQPSNTRIVRVSASGTGQTLEDNTQAIATALTAYNNTQGGSDAGASVSDGAAGSAGSGQASATGGAGGAAGTSGSGGAAGATGGASASGGSAGSTTLPAADAGAATPPPEPSSGGCSTAPVRKPGAGWIVVGLAALVGASRRRRTRPSETDNT